MEATLTVIGGKTSKQTITLKKLPAVIGRGKEAKLSIAHPMISRRHCELFEKGGLLMVRDLGSLNGTRVAGRRIKEAPVPPGGEFSIGPLSFSAEYQFPGDRKALPAVIWAEPAAGAAATEEEPDFEDIDDTSPVPPAATKAPKPPKAANAANAAKAAKRHDDDEVSFFEELGLDDSDGPASDKQLATTESVSKPSNKAAGATPQRASARPEGKSADPSAARAAASPAKKTVSEPH
jgi:predicted component of type VI protein secretion system